MGASTSKQGPNGQYDWKASGPPSVSLDVVDSLRSNPETDASRARLIEQHVQARVAEELKKLQKKESEALNAAHDKIATSEGSSSKEKGETSFSLGKEVDELRRKLEERKKVRDLPENVEKARSQVIQCLRQNDRRPLDCWQEVENFKAEVKKMEKSWVDKVTS
ncbi:hypothetical protein QQS21_010163 [Conoideocrella luteorostrata]|uniref:DUF1690 domain-containing protein n=1 Tax=Conoideocrella luteorostrata TaxID=1105319 RepID=A0AAJ0FX58_9HYPO|nr:hypothetical protein QQS21_010163 [Conoideocrella luteorostrata]